MIVTRALILSLFIVLPTGLFAGQKLTGEEIKSAFVGNTINWKHTKRSDSGKSFFDKSGKIIAIKNGKESQGSWSIEGNKFCQKTSKSTACRNVEKDDGSGYYLIKDPSKKVVHITKVDEGNSL